MRIVVIGGSGRVGSNVVRRLIAGTIRCPRRPDTGVDTISGEGLAEVMAGADVVVDVSNSPVWDDDAVLEFFTTSTRNLVEAEVAAGVGRRLAVRDRRARREQSPTAGTCVPRSRRKRVIEAGGVPHTILRATQFFSCVCRRSSNQVPRTAPSGCPPGLMQLVAADDVASTVAGFSRPARRKPAVWSSAGPRR